MSRLRQGFADEILKVARTYVGPGGQKATVPVQRMESPKAAPAPTRYRPAAPIRRPQQSAAPAPAAGGGRRQARAKQPASPGRGMSYQRGLGRLGTAISRGARKLMAGVKSPGFQKAMRAPKVPGAAPPARQAPQAPQLAPRTGAAKTPQYSSTNVGQIGRFPKSPGRDFGTRRSQQVAAQRAPAPQPGPMRGPAPAYRNAPMANLAPSGRWNQAAPRAHAQPWSLPSAADGAGCSKSSLGCAAAHA